MSNDKIRDSELRMKLKVAAREAAKHFPHPEHERSLRFSYFLGTLAGLLGFSKAEREEVWDTLYKGKG